MKVGVAMSGGVDSAVSAFLLKQLGHDVFGFTCDLDGEYDRCISNAKKVCNKLDIEHFTIDLHNKFDEYVKYPFIENIKQNLTPIPCIPCNRIIKFGMLLEFCREKNAKLATGHYARIERNISNGEYEIFRAKDILKDQTHFLNQIKKEALKDTIFPLGNHLKSDVFRIAKENNLFQNFEFYKESQDVCFFNGKSYNEYIKYLGLEEKDGDIIHITTCKILGRHSGLFKYTIGQRRYINISWREPLYVVKKDLISNILFVGEENTLYKKELKIKNINVLSSEIENRAMFNCKVCLRDKTPLIDAKILVNNDKKIAKVILKNPARAITSGQSCAFYNNDKLLGGGEIVS